jgi:hypothetical protein
MLQVHGSIHHEGKDSTRGVEKAVSNSSQYREWLSYPVSGMARAVTQLMKPNIPLTPKMDVTTNQYQISSF